MISKKNLRNNQRFALLAIDTAELFVKAIPAIIALSALALAASIMQKESNRRVAINCPETISVVITHSTAVGPVYQCVSRAQLKGPAPALKP